MFAYCENDPINKSDPSGEDWQETAKIGLMIAGVGLMALAVISTGGGALVFAGAGIYANITATTAVATVLIGAVTTGIAVLQAVNDSSPEHRSNEYSGKSRQLKDGNRIDYEYYGNGNGNVHFQNKNHTKVKIWDITNGTEKYYKLPKNVAKVIAPPSVQSVIRSTINIVKSLAGI